MSQAAFSSERNFFIIAAIHCEKQQQQGNQSAKAFITQQGTVPHFILSFSI